MVKYEKDMIVTGYVTGIEPYGIFVNLEDGYDGLIHISEISSYFVKNVSDYATEGEILRVKILDVNEKKHHAKLSIKNINYRFDRNVKIEETEHGFKTLNEKLDTWVKEKINELDGN